jgi:hypothetical protein
LLFDNSYVKVLLEAGDTVQFQLLESSTVPLNNVAVVVTLLPPYSPFFPSLSVTTVPKSLLNSIKYGESPVSPFSTADTVSLSTLVPSTYRSNVVVAVIAEPFHVVVPILILYGAVFRS